MNLRRLLLSVAFITLALRCGNAASEEEAKPQEAAAAVNAVVFSAEQIQHGGVRWTAATSSEMVPTIEVPGQLVPNEDHTARIGAPAQARIMTVHVRIGDRVGSGKSLVTLQSQQASAARADVQKAEAEAASRRTALTYARMARERAERLLAAKAAARAEVERTQADEQAAQAALAQAEAEQSRAQSSVRQLGVVNRSGEAIVRAPISGVVFTRDAAPGAVVEAGAPLVSITDDSTLWLEASANDRAASTLRNGGEVRSARSADAHRPGARARAEPKSEVTRIDVRDGAPRRRRCYAGGRGARERRRPGR
jgi:RND family efflux transporter MFP subunit